MKTSTQAKSTPAMAEASRALGAELPPGEAEREPESGERRAASDGARARRPRHRR
jgi:hypothetical protein